MKRITYLAWAMLLVMVLVGCSETKNLAEGEILYTGIKEIAYDRKPKTKKGANKDSTGVITAVADAYNVVSGLLTGDASAADALQAMQQKEMTKAQKDSVRRVQKKDAEAYEDAKAEVTAALSYAPNNSLLGSSFYRIPFPMGLWAYNKYVYSEKRFGRWMFNHFATQPRYMTSANPRVRSQVARNTLRNFGYLQGTTSYDTIPTKHPRKAKVSYEIHPGQLYHLDTIRYQNFTGRADSLVQVSSWSSGLRQGDPFNVAKLDAERQHISEIFRNHGYYYFRPEYITFRADTLMRPHYVQLQVRPNPSTPPEALRQYYMGETRVNIYGYNDQELVDTIQGRYHFSMAHSGKDGYSPLKMSAVRKYFFYRHGSLYNQRLQDFIADKLGEMGIFSQLAVKYVPRDTTDTCDTLDVEVTARLDKPYDAEFKGNIANKSNGLLGPGVSFSMSKSNAFRGAETVSLEAFGSYEWQTGVHIDGNSRTINSYEYGVSLNLLYPRLTMLGLGKKLNYRAVTSTNYQIEAKWLNRASYFGRVTLGARLTYSYRRRRYVRHEFTPFRLDYDMMLNSTERFDSIINANQALYTSMRDQFVPSMQYTLNMTSRATARNPRSLTLTVKEAGNVTSGLYSALGQSWNKKDKHLFGVPFAQYMKVTLELTDKIRLGGPKSQLCGRFYAGTVVSYGNSTLAPYSDLFTVGGANSIRAFGVRSIGPGSYHPGRSAYSYVDQMGDLKLEANLEYRFPIVSSIYGAVFMDAGNVWLMRQNNDHPGSAFKWNRLGNDIALGTGAGLRYDLDFLVIRFDIGVGLHAPYDTGKNGYYNMPRFGKSLGYHLAIGYPF